MTGEIHEISAAIGSLQAEVRSLGRSLKQGRVLADQRHHENQTQLSLISNRVGDVEKAVTPLSTAVESMQPVVQNYQQNKMKVMGAIGLASVILTAIGWLISTFIGKAVAFIMSKITI